MKNQLSSIPISSFRHDFDFISVPVSSKGETRVAVHFSALFNEGENMSVEDASRRARELGGTRYAGRFNQRRCERNAWDKIYFVFKRNSRFALRLDIMKLRNQYKTK
jgi:hypothetical protein